jgi:hypothetical protein
MPKPRDAQQSAGSTGASAARGRRELESGELRRVEPVSDTQILAAVERAELHNERQDEGVLRADLAEHLGFLHSGWTTRQLRPQLDALRAAGLLRDLRRQGLNVVGITSAGRRALAQARTAGETIELPESPQHRRWRHARSAAGERIDGFRQQVHAALDEARRLLDADQVPSGAWFDLAGRLKTECWQLGSATYCLREWPEPGDDCADVDEVRGRRNVWQWKDADGSD